jgi:DNA-binding transcriptional ArsR family regulator
MEGRMSVSGFSELAVLRVKQVEVGEPQSAVASRQRASRPSYWVNGEFLSGPIPMSWLGRACGLSSQKVLAVALAIWFVSGLRKSREGLLLTRRILHRFCVTERSTKYRALKALEKAGLIRVERRPRRNPFITILAVA